MTADLSGTRARLQARALTIALRAADITVELTQQATSRRSGALANSIQHTQPAFLSDAIVATWITAGAPYARWQDEGTGIYGPTGARIFPRTARVLRFDWPAAGGVVFARSVAGAPGRHYFKEPMPLRWRTSLAQVVGG